MININSAEWLERDRRIINNKGFLNLIYEDFYTKLKSTKLKRPTVEIGSGAGFIKKIIPGTVTTDVINADGIDIKASAEKLPFKNKSIGSIVMVSVFHHIKDPTKALKEFERILVPGGKIVMIEPWVSLFSKFIYKNFHHENFDEKSNWKIKGVGRMSDANGAIPWIIFHRDKNKFRKMFPNLEIVNVKPHTPFRYLFSGGLSKPQLIPTSMYTVINKIEEVLAFFSQHIAMFATIEIVKSKSARPNYIHRLHG